MNKLQLYITKSFDGYKVLFNINPSEEVTRHVHELRKIVEKVKYDTTEKNIFYYVTNTSGGTFVTIIRTIPSNPIDHLAAWIFIPNQLVIDATTLERVVNTTTRKVSGDRVTSEDVAALRELFSIEYLTDPEAAALTASKPNGAPAWRAYNGNTGISLADLFGPGLFQVPYLDYNGVLFVDAELGIEVKGDNLTTLPIEGPAVILPPEKTPEQFSAYVFGRPLDCPLRATLNANLTVTWKHPGFEDVVKQEVIDRKDFTPALPDTSSSRKAVTRASFQIASQSGRVPIDECTITVNGQEIGDEPRLFTTAELVGATVTINCDGYAPYSAKIDLAASTKALVRIQERTKVYCFEMPVKRADLGAPVRFKIFTKKIVTDSPLEGYSLQDDVMEGETRTNHLIYTGTGISLVNKGIYVGVGLLVGLILGWLTTCGGGNTAPAHVDSIPQEEVLIEDVVTQPQPAQPSAQAPTGAAATAPQAAPAAEAKVTPEVIAYLDNNPTWSKEEMAKYPALNGLFDDLNNFRLEKLSGEWAHKLQASRQFSKLSQHAEYGMNPKKKAKSKIEGDTFVKGGKNSISVQSYLYRIDP